MGSHPTTATDPGTVDLVSAAVRAVGAQLITLDADTHDWRVAVSSHAPHAVAVAQVLAAGGCARSGRHQPAVGRGLAERDPCCGGRPRLWADILGTNALEVIAALDAISESIADIREMLLSGDRVRWPKRSYRAATLRIALQEPVQDSRIPAFRELRTAANRGRKCGQGPAS